MKQTPFHFLPKSKQIKMIVEIRKKRADYTKPKKKTKAPKVPKDKLKGLVDGLSPAQKALLKQAMEGK